MKHASIFAEAGHLKKADILSSPAATYMLQNFLFFFLKQFFFPFSFFFLSSFFFFTVNNQIISNVLPSERHIKLFFLNFFFIGITVMKVS